MNKNKIVDALIELSDCAKRVEHNAHEANGIDRAIRLIEGMADDDWVSVDEYLPEEYEKVWVTTENVGGYRRCEESVFRNGSFWTNKYITLDVVAKAWMPRHVPEPYQQEGSHND